MNANGTGRTIAVQSSAPLVGLDWAPDGRKLVFAKGDPFHRWIHIVNPDGSGLRRLTDTNDPDSDPSWSPDGTRIAFARDVGEGNTEIYVMNYNGTNQKKITTNPARDSYPQWGPEADQIAFVTDRDGNDEIYVMKPDGKGLKNLTNSSASDTQPAWSPDGTKIVFVSDRNQDGQDVHIMDSDGKNLARLTRSGASETQPDFGPAVGNPELPPPEPPEKPTIPTLPLNFSAMDLRTIGIVQDELVVRKEVVVALAVTNADSNKTWSSVAVLQVRDSLGITQHLDLQNGTVLPNAMQEFRFSWKPESVGTYELIVVLLENAVDPRVLSEKKSMIVSVSGRS
jgi:hypothetical protein